MALILFCIKEVLFKLIENLLYRVNITFIININEDIIEINVDKYFKFFNIDFVDIVLKTCLIVG